jgi:hypothetical protein
VLDQAKSDFIDDVSAYYQAKGSWTGVAAYLPPPVPAPLPQPQPGARPPQPQPGNREQPERQPPPPFAFALVDQDGDVVVPAGPYRVGDRVPATELEQGTAVEIDGQGVGTVLTTGEASPLDPREERYLAHTHQALLGAALGAMA